MTSAKRQDATSFQSRIIESKKFYEIHLLNALGDCIIDASITHIGEYIFDVQISTIVDKVNKIINDPLALKLMKMHEIPIESLTNDDIDMIIQELEKSLIRGSFKENFIRIILPEEAMKDNWSIIFHKRSKDIPDMISISKHRRPLLEKIVEARNKHLATIIKLIEEEIFYALRVKSIHHDRSDIVTVDYLCAKERCCDAPPDVCVSYLYKQYTPPNPNKWWENAGLPDNLKESHINYIVHYFTSKGYPVIFDGIFKFVL